MTVGKFGVALPVPRKSARLISSITHPVEWMVCQSAPWIDHELDELVAQAPELESDLDGYESPEHFSAPDPLDGRLEAADILLMFGHQLRRKQVRPELRYRSVIHVCSLAKQLTVSPLLKAT